MPPIRAQIQTIADLAGETYTPTTPAPATTRGPDQDDIANAADLSATDRNAMIQGMVGTLSARLATQGGTASEWAQLITAHSVLNDMASAIDVWQEAQITFADAPDDLAIIAAAATHAGLLSP
jgi:cytochrome c-type biogenesis protein CcmH